MRTQPNSLNMHLCIDYCIYNLLYPTMKTHQILLPVLIVMFSISCSKDEDSQDSVKSYNILGSIQKGPFINGSNLIIYELNNEYKQTGKSFFTNTENQGQYEIVDISLESSNVEVIADGFYFNEISGNLSDERISLKAIMAIAGLEVMNVNVLTHLEYDRVKYLILHNNYSIQDAKEQAQSEILAVFSLDEYSPENSEVLDICNANEGDAILLAISAILQGNHTTAELSKLLADFIVDLKEDGVLGDTLIQSELLGQALALNCDQIRQNLTDRYDELGVELTEINNFEDYINHFISNSSYTFSSPFAYPESTENGFNILDPEQLEFQIIMGYSFAVKMPGAGKIVVIMHKTEGPGGWWYQPSQTYGWKVSNFDFTNDQQVFTSILNGVTIDLPIEFSEYGRAIIEYYYNGSENPAITKAISWGGQNNTDFIFPYDSPMGYNLLNLLEGTELESDTTYTVSLQKPGIWDVEFILTYSEGISIEVPGGWGLYTYNDTGDQVNFTLSGKDEYDYVSEIIFRLSGIGTLNISSDDLEIEEGSTLNRNFTVN